jgi:hypothetical protein
MTDERLVELGFTRAPPPFNARAAPPRGAGMPSIVFIAAGGRRRQAARQLPSSRARQFTAVQAALNAANLSEATHTFVL